MKKIVSMMLVLVLLFSVGTAPAFAASPSVTYRAHSQNIGWSAWRSNGQIAGSQGKGLRMEDLQIKLSGISGGVKYSAHCQNYGWRSYVSNGASCGTTGKSLRMEAIKIELTGTAAAQYDIYYRVHVAGIGTMSWVKNGEVAGTTGQSRQIESIEIKLVAKGKSTSSNSSSLTSPVPSGCKFSKKTVDQGFECYHDINCNVSTKTPVYAIADGTVTFYQAYRTYSGVQKLTSYGNYVKFTSSDGVYKATYAHLSSFNGVSQVIPSSRTVQASGSEDSHELLTKTVKKGEILGYIGTTGNSSNTHLHFELYKNNKRIDPTSVISGLI